MVRSSQLFNLARFVQAVALVSGLTMLMLGCGDPTNDTDLWNADSWYVVQDSADVEVVTTDRAVMQADLGWTVDPDAEMSLGQQDGDITFHDVRGVMATADGAVVVDGGTAEVRYFDADGVLISRAGGHGEGPGEFALPHLIRSRPGGPVQIFDRQLRRYVQLDGGGTVLEERRIPGLIGRPLGVAGDRFLVELQFITPPSGPGVQRSQVTFQWQDTMSGDAGTIAVIPIDQGWVAEIPGNVAVMELPFSPRPAGVVHGDRALLTRGHTFRIEAYDQEGGMRRIMHLDAARSPATEAELTAHFEYAEWRHGGAPARELYASAPIPDSLPAFSSLIEDGTGWLWAQLYTVDRRQPSHWVVFDPDGRARGRVTTPPRLEVHEIGRDFVLGVARDEWGVEIVQRHRLTRN